MARTLLDGGLIGVNDRSLGWMIKEKVSQDRTMMKNHGLGFNWGMSLRRAGDPQSLA